MFKSVSKKKNDDTLNAYLHSKSAYRNTCRHKRNTYNKTYLNKVESCIGTTKTFWREIKKVLRKPKTVPDISLDDWFNHFSALFANNDTDSQHIDPLVENASQDCNLDGIQEMIFNSDITDDEILKSVKLLKLNKASGGNVIPQQFVYGVK